MGRRKEIWTGSHTVASYSVCSGLHAMAIPRMMLPTRSKSKKKAAATDADERSSLGDLRAASEAALALFHPITAQWFRAVFDAPTAPQVEGWPAIARGESTLILAPTGTGKTLTAFLWCLDKLMMRTAPDAERRVPGGLSFAAEGAGCGRGAESAIAAGGDCEYGEAGGCGGADAGDQRADGGYFAEGASAVQRSILGIF